MAQRNRSLSETATANTTPAPFVPTVRRVTNADFKISEAQFCELEKAGQVKLDDEHRRLLQTLASAWAGDLAVRLTPRPKVFRKCLDDVINAAEKLERACQWDEHPMYHLIHWAMETKVEGAQVFHGILTSAEHAAKGAREIAEALKKVIPSDPGRQRPFDDERRIIQLRAIYEEAGGKATVYSSAYSDGGIAETPFRSFAQCFYSVLPAEDKRDPGGLDEALRLASMARSAKVDS